MTAGIGYVCDDGILRATACLLRATLRQPGKLDAPIVPCAALRLGSHLRGETVTK